MKSPRNQYVVIVIVRHELPLHAVVASRAACARFRLVTKHFTAPAHWLSHRGCDLTGNPLRSAPQWVGIEVSVALGRACLRVAEQLADDGKTKAGTCTNTCMRVTQVVQANAVEAGALRDKAPRPIKIVTRAIRVVRRDHICADARKFRQNGQGRGVEHNGFATGLAVRQQQQTALEVYIIPFEPEDFAEAGAGEDQ